MYITHDNQTYPGVRVYATTSSVRFTGESLAEISELTGLIMVFAENGFHLRSFDPTDFLRQEILNGSRPNAAAGHRSASHVWSSCFHGKHDAVFDEGREAGDSRRDHHVFGAL